jgi:hypothetical protein
VAQSTRHQQRTGGFRHQRKIGERHAQFGIGFGNDEIAVQQHGGAHADGAALHGGDQNAAAGGQCVQEAKHRRVLARRPVGDEIGEVVAGGETLAGAGEYYHGGTVGFGLFQCAGQGRVHRHRKGVALGRSVEAQVQQGALAGHLDLRRGHGNAPQAQSPGD